MNTNQYSFESQMFELISLKQEGEFWDFKKVWYQKKSDLLHDIICMANNLTNNDAYIIIGVNESENYNICDVSEDPKRRSTQNLVDF
jgi:predicted HTH transcriptional regulator